ncbi:MAG: Gx transporter family protein [Bacilli bacterium]|nr:Gx transporter family protein [Bacilli bacterium]
MSPWIGGLIGIGAAILFLVLFVLIYRKSNMFGVRKIVLLGLFLALAIALGMFESMIPDFLVPGFKLGLANIAIVLLLFGAGWKEALLVDVLRVVLVSLLRGNFMTMGGWMSFAGMALSFLGMLLIHLLWKKASVIFVSIIGALLHDVGQIFVAFIYMENGAIFYYLPFMVLVSLATGALAGIVAYTLLKRESFTRLFRKEEAD